MTSTGPAAPTLMSPDDSQPIGTGAHR